MHLNIHAASHWEQWVTGWNDRVGNVKFALTFPFHSDQICQWGYVPTWYNPPESHASAIGYSRHYKRILNLCSELHWSERSSWGSMEKEIKDRYLNMTEYGIITHHFNQWRAAERSTSCQQVAFYWTPKNISCIPETGQEKKRFLSIKTEHIQSSTQTNNNMIWMTNWLQPTTSSHDRSKVKAEAIYMHLSHPISERQEWIRELLTSQ